MSDKPLSEELREWADKNRLCGSDYREQDAWADRAAALEKEAWVEPKQLVSALADARAERDKLALELVLAQQSRAHWQESCADALDENDKLAAEACDLREKIAEWRRQEIVYAQNMDTERDKLAAQLKNLQLEMSYARKTLAEFKIQRDDACDKNAELEADLDVVRFQYARLHSVLQQVFIHGGPE